MYINVIKAYRNIIAICDVDLIGKYFSEEKLQLNIKENFYKGKKVNKKEAIKILQNYLKEDATFNIVGKKSIKTAQEAGIITPDSIGRIQNIPFALVLI